MTHRPRAAQKFQLALVVAGVTLFTVLVRNIGPEQLIDDLRQFGFAIAGVIGFELVIDACNTVAWRKVLPPDAPVSFWILFWVRQSGVAINQLTPTATVGGEVAKTALLRPRLSVPTTAASLVAARTSYALGQAGLVLLGVAVTLERAQSGPELGVALILAFLMSLGGVLGFVWLQRRGMFSAAIAGVRRLGIARGLVERIQAGGIALDSNLATFYRDRPRAFGTSVAWHIVGQLVGLLQLSFILEVLGAPTPLATCLAIEAFALTLDSVAFLVPGRIGVQEASRVLVFTTFGLGAATGLAVAVIVRLNQLAVAALGLVAFASFSVAPLGPPGRPDEARAHPTPKG